MQELKCMGCDSRGTFKPYKTNLYKYENERVQTCAKCGYIRTKTHRRVREGEMVYIPTQTKNKNMEDES